MVNPHPALPAGEGTILKGRVFFIYPPSPVLNREDRYQQPLSNTLLMSPLPPADLMYLAAIAEECGFEAKIRDYSQGGDFIADLQEFNPHYLVVNVATPTFLSDMDWIKQAKEANPSLTTIVKGAPFLTYNANAIYENTFLDYVIVGEPEFTLRDILNGVPDNEILGICYRENFQAVQTEKRPFIENLDLIPFPARHLVDNSKYIQLGNIQAVIKLSRGCPFHCFSCLATPVSGSKVRVRSYENIIDEIKECIEKYKIKNFLLDSDIFNFDHEWTLDLCKKIIESGLKITWATHIKVDKIDNELAKLLYKSGCRIVYLGVESGSQEILDHIGKETTLEQVRNAVKILKKNKIKIYNQFVIGLPWENEQTVEETIKFAIELDSNFASFNIAAPFPGTKFFAYAMTNHLAEGNLDFKNAYNAPVVRSHALSKDRIFELRKLAIRRFYLRPKFILRTLLSIRSFTEFKNYFLTGLNLLRH